MLEILQFYVSGFWVWLGITIALALVLKWTVVLIISCIAAIRGSNVKIKT